MSLYHLRTKFEPDRLERVANTLLRKDLGELRPYYGDEADTDGLYHSVAKRGTRYNARIAREDSACNRSQARTLSVSQHSSNGSSLQTESSN